MLWLDEFGLHDADDEAVACLVRRLDTLAAPFDGDAERIEACIGDLIDWVSARVDGHGRAGVGKTLPYFRAPLRCGNPRGKDPSTQSVH